MSPKDAEPLRILRRQEVARRTGRSIATIYRDIKLGRFPAPVPLSLFAVGWIESEVSDWIKARVAERDAGGARPPEMRDAPPGVAGRASRRTISQERTSESCPPRARPQACPNAPCCPKAAAVDNIRVNQPVLAD
jgi:prophage regulatory protein